MQDANALAPNQDLRFTNLVQSRDGMYCDKLRSTGPATDRYLANTNLNGTPSQEYHNHPDTSDAENANPTNPTNTHDACPANGINLDAADVTDANAFQDLSRSEEDLMTTNPCKITMDRPSDILKDGAEQTIAMESNFSDASTVVVDLFPFGNPGAPIPGVSQGRSSYVQFQASQGDAVTPQLYLCATC